MLFLILNIWIFLSNVNVEMYLNKIDWKADSDSVNYYTEGTSVINSHLVNSVLLSAECYEVLSN